MLQIYTKLNKIVKEHINIYNDPLKVFLEMSLNQIDFFKPLNKMIKNEWIFNMKMRQLEVGSYLYRIDTNSEEMYVIQSGLVEIVHKMDNGQEFVIEKLYRGSVVNQNSFLMSDGIDTDAICRTAVSYYYIDINKVKQLRAKSRELEDQLIQKEMQLVNPNAREPALDYIIKDPYSNQHFFKNSKTGELVHDYNEEERRRKLTVKLKNAIMIYWLDVKEARKKPTFDEIIQDLLKKKRLYSNEKDAFIRCR